MKILSTPRLDQCIGCHSCSLACARLVHKRVSWLCAGIRIESAGGISTGYKATRCLACDPPPCTSACPTEALQAKKEGGVVFRRKLCISCGRCVPSCPVDAIYQNPDKEIFVCIHCGRCVDFCPQNCLEYLERDEIIEVTP